MERLSSGIPDIDDLMGGLIPGENIVSVSIGAGVLGRLELH